MKKTIFIGIVFVLLSSSIDATDVPSELTAQCVACHGANGISENTQWPNLAGQQIDYLINEMKAFRDGARQNQLMTPQLLQNLSDQQLSVVANYYAQQPASKGDNQGVNLSGKNVRARCVSCHGMSGHTVSSLWPNIAGQQAGYIKKQLMDFKSGTRPGPTMQVIASELTEQQISDVAEYYSQQ